MVKKSQSTIEYMLFIATMIIVLFFAFSKNKASLRNGIDTYVEKTGEVISGLIK